MIQKIGIVEPGKEGCMTERNRKGGLRTGGMRNGRDAGKEGYMKGGIRDWRDSGLEGHKRRVTGKEGSR